jgi:hypothetical protein
LDLPHAAGQGTTYLIALGLVSVNPLSPAFSALYIFRFAG